METALIEAILFLESEPIDIARLVKISGLSKELVEMALENIHSRHDVPESGLQLTENGGTYTFSPKKLLWENLKDHYGKKGDDRISRAAMETLSIIAYSQPITRSEIEGIRGVSSGGVLKILLEKNLIKEIGRKDAPGRPFQYGTTKDFLKLFRLNSIAELPKLDDTDKERFELNGN